MKMDSDNLDLFCRVNIQAELSHPEFVSFLARSVGGVSRSNSIRSDTLDISVDDNDVFDAAKSRIGQDRWLYFRYTLEIDPIKGVSPKDYIAAIGTLLQLLWSSHLDAVASCDFEEQLPRNVRRLRWAKTPRPERNGTGGAERIEVADVVIPATGKPGTAD